MDGPSVRHTEASFCTAAEASRLLDAAEGDRMATRWSAGLGPGLRQGEVHGLAWDAVDLTPAR